MFPSNVVDCRPRDLKVLLPFMKGECRNSMLLLSLTIHPP